MIDTLIGFGLGFLFGGCAGIILTAVVVLAGRNEHDND